MINTPTKNQESEYGHGHDHFHDHDYTSEKNVDHDSSVRHEVKAPKHSSLNSEQSISSSKPARKKRRQLSGW